MHTKLVKELCLAALAIATNIVALWLWKENMPTLLLGEFAQYQSIILPLLGLVFAASFFALAAIFIENPLIAYSAALIACLAPFLFLPASNVVLGTCIASFLLVALSVHRIRREYAFSIEFSVVKIFKQGIPFYFTVASLLTSLFYLSLLDTKSAIISFFPKPVLEVILTHFSGPLESLSGMKDINPNITVDELLRSALRRDAAIEIPPHIMSDEELIRDTARNRVLLEQQYGIVLKGDERLSDAFQTAMVRYIEKLLGPWREYFPYAAAAGFFFAYKLITFPLYFISMIFVVILIEGMKYGTLLTKRVQQIEVERLSL